MNTPSAIAATAVLPMLALTLAGCTTNETPLPKEVTTALETAFNKGDLDACVSLYADDAEILSKFANSVRGKNAIGAFFKDQMAREILFDTDTTVSADMIGDEARQEMLAEHLGRFLAFEILARPR